MSLDITETYEPINIDDEMFGSSDHLNKIIGSTYALKQDMLNQLVAGNLYSASKEAGTEFFFNTAVTSINVENGEIKLIIHIFMEI